MINYQDFLSDKAKSIKPSGIRRFFDIAAEMDDVISLSIGEPDFQTPWHVRQAGILSLEKGKTWYTPNKGLSELRNEVSKFFSRKYRLDYSPESEILITVGGSEAIDLSLRTLLNNGDEVLIPQPSFVCYEPLVKMASGNPITIETKKENDFRLTPNDIIEHITPKTKVLILPFPNNPTGAVMREQHLKDIAKIINDYNLFVISDEIYSELTYGEERHVSIAQIDKMKERTIVINGFSKAYAMTGWRLGYALGPKEIISEMTKVHQYSIMSSPTTAQYAAIEALKNGDNDIEYMREQYDMRRRLLLDGLKNIGLECFEPEGAFYVFPSIKNTGLTSEEFCEKLLYSQHVAVVPGNAFGISGEGFIRISYSYSIKHINEALKRIKSFIDKLNIK